MGCFLGCFGGEPEEIRKERRRRRSAKRLPHRDRRSESARSSSLVAGEPRGPRQPSLTQVTPGPSHGSLPLDPTVESAYCEKTFPLDKSVDCSSEKTIPPESTVNSFPSEKNLQQDPPVHSTTQEEPPSHTPLVPVKAEVSEIRGAIEKKNGSSLPRKKVTFDLNVTKYEPVEERCYSSDDETEEETHQKSQLLLSPTCVAFPSNHRYQNCDSDDEEALDEEEEEEDYYYSDSEEEEGLDELDEGIGLDEIGIRIEGNEEESYESFFSLSIDKERELSDNNNNEAVSSLISTNPSSTDKPGLNTRDRSQFVHPVLNPVENLSQWKQAKVNLSEKLTTKDKTINSKLYKENKGDEVSVDMSLSLWLVSEEISKVEKEQVGNLSFSREDRPILGALTMDDIKESSVNSSPRRSPSRSPSHDDVPIIGTVGSYWSCNMGVGSRSTRFREEKIGKCR